jgi:hypothetical protein
VALARSGRTNNILPIHIPLRSRFTTGFIPSTARMSR